MNEGELMYRRDFLKLAGLASLSVVSPGIGNAQSSGYDGPLWMMINTSGGWDATGFCDPKGRVDENAVNPINMYFTDQIHQTGPFRYAPIEQHIAQGQNSPNLAGFQSFFEKYQSELLIINGVDVLTNNHDIGTRHSWSGRLDTVYPSFGGIVAGAMAPQKPLSYITNGGYDATHGVVATARVGNLDTLRGIAEPQHLNVDHPEQGNYHLPNTLDRIMAARQARTEAQMVRQKLPRKQKAINELYLATSQESELRQVLELLEGKDMNPSNPLLQQGRFALASYKAGLTVSVNLNIGGFDTHGQHDDSHYPLLQQVTDGVDLIMQEAEDLGVADRVVIVVASDFGRTPSYNATSGKDHWNITSMMLMGPGIRGNRVIGGTDDGYRALAVNPDTLELDENGIVIQPDHIHSALRHLAGVENSAVAQQYPLSGNHLNLFL